MKKRIICIALIIVTMLSGSFIDGVSAETIPEAKKYLLTTNSVSGAKWSNAESIVLTLSFGSGKANVGASLMGKTSVIKVSAVFRLKKKNSSGSYVTVKEWKAATIGRILNFSSSYAVDKGTYRFYVDATFLSATGTSETVTCYIEKVYK